MQVSLAAKLLVAAATAVSAAASSGSVGSAMDHMLRYQNMHLERQQQAQQQIAIKLQSDEDEQNASRFLTDKTKKFAVDGKSLPDIDFDLGESYSGLLPIGNSNDSSLFFWFFPSEDEDADKEIVIWFTGGPGCSSMSGLFEENGPVTWMPGSYKPIKNSWSWHKLSNVVWVDQPVGTGYTTGEPTAKGEEDVADQFRGFWKNFVDTFEMQGYSVYITGESYGGMYCPYIAKGMLDQNDTEYFNVSGMLIYDGVLNDDPLEADVTVQPFMELWDGLFPFNDSAKEEFRQRHNDCGYADYLEKYLVFPASGPQPSDPKKMPGLDESGMYRPECSMLNIAVNKITDLNPCFNIYQVTAGCPIPYDPLGFAGATYYYPEGAPPLYFDRAEVKKALHVSTEPQWAMCKNGVFPNGDNSAPSSHFAIPSVIDRTNNVMLVHGDLDMILLANGSMLAIQNMTWGGELGFQERPSKPMFVPYHDNPNLGSQAGGGVYGTAHTERGLTWVFVTLSGHMVPANQPSVAFRQLQVLLGRVENLQSTEAFPDSKDYPQPGEGQLGEGTAPPTWLGGS